MHIDGKKKTKEIVALSRRKEETWLPGIQRRLRLRLTFFLHQSSLIRTMVT